MYIVILPIVFLLFGLLFYLLYINGYISLRTVSTLYFFGSANLYRNCSAKFTRCSGSIKRILKFNDTRLVTFTFDSNINEGSVDLFILNKDKETVLTLNSDNPTGTLTIQAKERYYIKIKFCRASGNYKLNWE